MDILKKIRSAGEHGTLFEVTIANIEDWINSNFLPSWALASIEELVEKEAWKELNNRFYKYLEFGTGGMRGRTIGELITKAEKGIPMEFEARGSERRYTCLSRCIRGKQTPAKRGQGKNMSG